MRRPDVTADRSEVLAALLAIEKLLHRHEVSYESVVRDVRERIEMGEGFTPPGEFTGEVRDMFGGMGSLNDVFISKLNGHVVEDEDAANRRFEALRTELWELVASAEDDSFS